MDANELLTDHFERIRELYVAVPTDLSAQDAHHRPGGSGNPVAWLLWHTARVQDDHVARLAGVEQAWHDGWSDRLDLPFDRDDIGYGHTPSEVAALRVDDLQPLGDLIRVRAGELSADITPQSVTGLDLAPGHEVVFSVKAAEVSVYRL